MRYNFLNILTPILVFSIVSLSVIEPNTSDQNNLSSAKVLLAGTVDDIYERFEKLETDLQDYIWPTDASTRITSTFAEYRSTHFHGGIDISTNNKNGYKVFAVRDGYVWRIRVQPNGYGKMLYIKHKDGFYTTYAHLQKFSERINKITRKEQLKQEIYAVDFILDSTILPVKKGEVIAYTGDTGVGPPHLHFEIRDENLNPVNPFLFSNFQVTDNSPPIIKKIFVAPDGFESKVNGSYSPFIFNNKNSGLRNIELQSPIRIAGRVKFGIETIDLANEFANRSGVYSLSLFLNDSLIYNHKFERIPAEDSKQILLHYDLPLIRQGIGKFQKLFIEEGTTLPIYNRMPYGSGIIDTRSLKEGYHSFRIEASDYSGTTSQLKGRLLVNRLPEIGISNTSENEIILNGDNLELIDKIIVESKSKNSPKWLKQKITKRTFKYDGNNLKLKINKNLYSVIKIIAVNSYGCESFPAFYFAKETINKSFHNFNISKVIHPHFVELIISTSGYFTKPPSVKIQEGNSEYNVLMKGIDVNKYSGVYIPNEYIQGQYKIIATAEINNNHIVKIDTFDLYPITANKAGEFFILNGSFKISYDSGAVFKPLIVYIDSIARNGSTKFSIHPQDVLLKKSIKITYNKKEIGDGLYFRYTDNWIYQPQDSNINDKTLEGTMWRTLGDVAILKDTQNPTISHLKIQTKTRKPIISFKYFDDLSGFDDKRLRMYINNNLVIPEIDGENRRIWYEFEQNLLKGTHKLRIVFADKAGNFNEHKTIFKIH